MLYKNFYEIARGTLVQKVASWKKAAKSAVRVLQHHHHFLNHWQQPEKLIQAGARK